MKGTITHRKMLTATGDWETTPVYAIDGREVTAEEFARHFPDQEIGLFGVGSLHSGWPMRSDATGVNPKDRQKAMDAAAKAGVPTYVDRLGRPVLTSLAHQRKYNKFRGFHNNDDNA